MKKETVEKKKVMKGLMLAYILVGIVALIVVVYLIFWYNNESLKTVQWNFT